MKYCQRCLYPETKPDLTLNAEGVCSACTAYDARSKIDWDARKNSFHAVCYAVKNRATRSDYDCIVPVSGGKDSHFQVLKALEFGLRPLAVTATTDSLSDIGRHNLENIGRLGVDHIEVSTNPLIRRRINKLTLMEIGDISWAEHVAIFTIPIRVAVALKIPMILWGENPQNEYGGPIDQQSVIELSRAWLAEFGGLNGLRVDDVADALGLITERDMPQYIYPSDRELDGLSPLFLGYFFPWDGEENAKLAIEHGFQAWSDHVEGSLAKYENLDNYQTGIHDYYKYLKYGFGRATDIACNRIRRGRLTRAEGVALVKERDGQYPHTCLGKPLGHILLEISMSIAEFNATAQVFANKALFENGDPTKPLFEVV